MPGRIGHRLKVCRFLGHAVVINQLKKKCCFICAFSLPELKIRKVLFHFSTCLFLRSKSRKCFSIFQPSLPVLKKLKVLFHFSLTYSSEANQDNDVPFFVTFSFCVKNKESVVPFFTYLFLRSKSRNCLSIFPPPIPGVLERKR